MKTQIPIYRAKKIDSGEYVIGWLANPTPSLFYIFYNHCGYLNVNNEVCIQENERAEIDPSTLAIHFPDMLDSEGTKIFASLSEDGRGGDILYSKAYSTNLIILYQTYTVAILDYNKRYWVRSNIVSEDIEVVGIQK